MTMLNKVERKVKALTRNLPPRKLEQRVSVHKRTHWRDIARPEQLQPEGEWLTWLIMAGRGFGKTRTGSETIAQWARETSAGRFALIGQTFADARDVMVEGESGLLSVLDPGELRGGTVDTAWNRSLGELYLKNGAKIKIYSSEKPRQLRGPQHHGAWGDEPATWNDANRGTADDTTWSNLLFGLRLGSDPRVVLTGTPRPVRLIRELLKADDTAVTRGSTYDNLDNLATTFKKKVLEKYEGTRLGRQELDGELLEDTLGALWKYGDFNREGFRLRFEDTPDLTRIVVGIDPQATQGSGAETGIIVAGKDGQGNAYVMGDLSGDFSPSEWANAAIEAYDYHRADAVVPERNNGGDMVEHTIRTIRSNVNIKAVWASRGKHTRAEPISSLYQQNKVFHVGAHKDLEDQMTTWVLGEKSPDRLDALVWALTELMLGDEPSAFFIESI